mmetsp:Transcript_84435/g.273399  ORF Transcript_84435/g.273399 Transcript_84435/m.273399 type:complete len:583 (+) Transcript_84435:93-1841(+)
MAGIYRYVVGSILIHLVLGGPIVHLQAGDAEGATDGTDSRVGVWRGIPFAAPPLGDLRWRPPQPADKWYPNVLDATQYKDGCVMGDAPFEGLTQMEGTSEDCLYINVFAPLPISEPLKPVFLWIHGGGFQGEDAAVLNGTYDVSHSNGSMILVTFNYRVNVFGFAASTLLRGRDPEGGTGNYGILDQRFAMQWVRDNIAEFGGDASRVTIVGQSAGGDSVVNHMVRRKSHGLFAGAVIMSGAFLPTGGPHLPGDKYSIDGLTPGNYTVEDQDPFFMAMMERANCTDVDCLLQLSATDLFKIRISPDRVGPGTSWQWVPQIDGVDLVANLPTLVMRGDLAPVPVLVGSNAEDVSCGLGNQSCDPEACTESDFRELCTSWWGFNATEADRLVHLYGNEAPRFGLNVSKWYWAAHHASTDCQATCPSRRMARWVTQAGQPAFWYYWKYAPGPPTVVGAWHGYELPYLFHQGVLPNASDWSDKVVSYWTSFVTSGNPHVPGLTSWPKYTPGKGSAMIFHDDMTTTVEDHFFEGKCSFWDDHFNEMWGLLPQTVDGGHSSEAYILTAVSPLRFLPIVLLLVAPRHAA